MAGAGGPQTGRGQGKTADLVLGIQALFVAGGQVSASMLTTLRQTQSLP